MTRGGRRVAVMAGAALLVTLAGCATGARTRTQTADTRSVNALCPLSSLPVDPEVPAVMHRGQAVGFCCDGCFT